MDEMLKAKQELVAKMKEIATGRDPIELAKIVGEPFDPENPVPDVVDAIFKTDTVDIGEDYEYFTSDQDTKKVTVVSSGTVTQTAVTPLTTTDLTFSTYSTEEFLVYVDKLLEGKHDMLAKKRIALTEALNRIEQQLCIAAVDTAVVAAANTYTLDSGKTKFDFPKAVEMARSIARYAQITHNPDGTLVSNLVLVTGANVTQDVILMDYDADKNRPTMLANAGIGRWIPVDEQQVTITATPTDVIGANVAYLVAPSKAQDKETAHFVRRKVAGLDGAGEKERISIARGPMVPEGSSPKWAFGVAAMEQFGCVIVNDKPLAKFTRS